MLVTELARQSLYYPLLVMIYTLGDTDATTMLALALNMTNYFINV